MNLCSFVGFVFPTVSTSEGPTALLLGLSVNCTMTVSCMPFASSKCHGFTIVSLAVRVAGVGIYEKMQTDSELTVQEA